MTAFENFVTLELPRRSPHLTVEITGYDGDPNDGAAPAVVKGAPKGTWYMQETPSVVWWRKQVSGTGGATTWVEASGGGAHATTHSDGGADEVDVGNLGSTSAPGAGYIVQADGAGGLSWATATTPGAHAASHQDGGADEVATATPAAAAIPKADGSGTLDGWISATSETVAGKIELATQAEVNAGTDTVRAVTPATLAGTTVTPESHASSHDAGGGDAMAIDAVAGTGSLRTLGTTSTSACAGDDGRLSDARTPTSHATSHQSAGGDALAIDSLGAASDTTDLDATTGAHGLLPKLGGGTTNFLRADGTWAAPTTSGGSGWIYIADAETQGSGTVTSKVWQDAPGNTVLQSFTTSSADLRVTVRASYPKVDLGGTDAVLTRDVSGGFYSGQVDVTVGGSGDLVATVVTGDDVDGAEDTTAVTLDLPPAILTLSFTGGYPGSQTELKAGDTYQVTGTTDKAIDQVEFLDYEAFQNSTVAASGTAFTVSGTIADRGDTAVLRPGRIRVRDAVTSAYSATRDTNLGGGTTEGVHLVKCNDLYPSVSFGAITYPGSQEALKNSETASVVNSVSNADTILYDSPNGDVSIADPTVIGTPKVVTRIAGSYNVTTNNLRAAANRAANDATTTVQTLVQIAHTALTITVSTPAARLRSGGNDGTTAQNHTITLTGSQRLLSAPSLSPDAGSSGTFIGSWAGGGTTWTRALQVHDDDDKGTKSWTSPSATNLAGIVTTSITTGPTYVLGGFVQRSLTFAAFQQTTTVNVAVVTYTKLTAGIFTATNQPALRNATQGDTSDIANTYTIQSPLNNNPQTLFWNDQSAAGSNSGGTAQITNLEETV